MWQAMTPVSSLRAGNALVGPVGRYAKETVRSFQAATGEVQCVSAIVNGEVALLIPVLYYPAQNKFVPANAVFPEADFLDTITAKSGAAYLPMRTEA
jgi:hypothetical protein